MAETSQQKSAYGKRPLWHWILLYLVIGAILYGAFYYFVLAKKGGYSAPSSYSKPTSTQSSSSATPDNIYMTKTSSAKGSYLTDFKGMSLYTFDKDTKGVSNCYGACATAWPPYTSGATVQGNLPANITVVTRTDGSKQFAWMGKPLYYYANDQNPGDVTGDGVGGTWHLVKP